MGCNCGAAGGKGAVSRVKYVVRSPDGTEKTYESEVEARVAARKVGGSYQALVGR